MWTCRHFWIMTKKGIQVVLKYGHLILILVTSDFDYILLILVTSDFDYIPVFLCWSVIDKK